MMYLNGHSFEAGCDTVDVTSMNRPDELWRHTDAHGHQHRWYADGKPVESYRPDAKYSLPSLRWVVDGVEYYEDGEPYEVGHYECVQCGEHVKPRSKPDTVQQFVPGLRWYRIDGRSVSREDFMAAVQAAQQRET